jgi:hypothetical protein
LTELWQQQAQIADKLTDTHLPEIEWCLLSGDLNTRRIAAYIVKVVYLNSGLTSIPDSTLIGVAKLLTDPSDAVRKTAVNTLEMLSDRIGVDAAVPEMVEALHSGDSAFRMVLIKTLGNVKKATPALEAALQPLISDDTAEIAHSARQALAKLGISVGPPDARAVVQKLIWTWKSSGGGMQADTALAQLRSYSDPMIVCDVVTATLSKGDWATEFAAGTWPDDFARLLGDIGDRRFIDSLLSLFRLFQSRPEWKSWSGYLSVAVLRLPGGWEVVRQKLSNVEAQALICEAVTSASQSAEELKDIDSYLSEEDKHHIVATIVAEEDECIWHRCRCLSRVGIVALDQLLVYYRGIGPNEAASAICRIPGALHKLTSVLTPTEIEELIARRYEYAGPEWNENIVRLLVSLKTSRSLNLLRKTWRDPQITPELEVLIKAALAGL